MPERIDRVGEHKTALLKNKKIILATQDVCALCGAPVDKTLKAPDPMSPNIDHIIPIAKGGHPSSLENLQLTHRWCNLHKGDKLFTPGSQKDRGIKNNLGMVSTPAAENTPAENNPPPNNPGGLKNPGPVSALVNLDAIDNDNLPLHADWTSFAW